MNHVPYTVYVHMSDTREVPYDLVGGYRGNLPGNQQGVGGGGFVVARITRARLCQ
jgi:hypothetical protein